MTENDSIHNQEKISNWMHSFETLMEQIRPHFAHSQMHKRCKKYVQGLLSSVKRKNGWQLAEYGGDSTPYGIQNLLGRARWDADAIRDELQQYVFEQLLAPDGVLVFDETGFLKKGKESAGVQRQYSGTAGRIENSQIGVFLGYASRKGFTFLDRRLYLPESWTQDPLRCQKSGIPASETFATKPELARQMLEHVFQTQSQSIKWVTADTVYGGNRRLRAWLEEQKKAYVLAVSIQESVSMKQGCYQVQEWADQTPETAWQCISSGQGSKGPREYDWVRYALEDPLTQGWKRWLLIRRHREKKEDVSYYLVYAPSSTSLERLVQVAGTRWTIERCFQEAKGEVGLDHYEVRSWTGWYRHITLAMLAHAFLAAMRAQETSTDALKKGIVNGKNSHFMTFKRRRGL
jgi:SRSO17 transposase